MNDLQKHASKYINLRNIVLILKKQLKNRIE